MEGKNRFSWVNTIGSTLKSPWIVTPVILGISTLLYIRRMIQGYWWDRRFDLSSFKSNHLKGKNVLITGGNSGIGKAAAIRFASLGAKVIITTRTEKKGFNAMKEICSHAFLDSADIENVEMDLCDIQSVHECVQLVCERYRKIDILILNAGIGAIHPMDSILTKDGLNRIFQANYFGHWVFCQSILNQIRSSKSKEDDSDKCRVISVSSGAHTDAAGIDQSIDWFENVSKKDACSYGMSKWLDIILIKKLALTHGDQILATSITPGMVYTPIFRKFMESYFGDTLMWLIYAPLYPFIRFMARSPEMGIQTILKVALDDWDSIKNGSYWSNCLQKEPKVNGKHVSKKDWDRIALDVWKQTEDLYSQFEIAQN